MLYQVKKALYNNLLPEDLFRTDISIERAEQLFRIYVDSVEIETHSYCNRTCWFCPNSFIDRRSKNIRLSLDVLKKIAVNLSSVEYDGRIVFSGYNEPLYDGTIFEWSKRLKGSCPKSIIIAYTNGDYLNNTVLGDCTTNGVDRLHVDLYPAEGKEGDQSEHARISKLFQQRTRLELTPSGPGYFFSRVNQLQVITRIKTYDKSEMSTRGGLLDIPKTKNYVRTATCVYPINSLTVHYSGEGMLCCHVRPDHATHRSAVIVDLNRSDENLFTYYRQLAAARNALVQTGVKSGVCRSCDVRDDIKAWTARRRLTAAVLSRIPNARKRLDAYIRQRRVDREGIAF